LSNALLEYMAARKAIVATAVGGTPRLIEHEVHGLLVPAGEPSSLARAILRLLEDRSLADRVAAAARARVEEQFSIPAMVRRFERFYEALLVRRGAATELLKPPRSLSSPVNEARQCSPASRAAARSTGRRGRHSRRECPA
jgi:hypothetical protein